MVTFLLLAVLEFQGNRLLYGTTAAFHLLAVARLLQRRHFADWVEPSQQRAGYAHCRTSILAKGEYCAPSMYAWLHHYVARVKLADYVVPADLSENDPIRSS